jgi:hypothetical protein
MAARLAEQRVKHLLMSFHVEPTPKSSQSADVGQMVIHSEPQKHSIGDVGLRFGKYLPIGQPVVKHNQFELQTKNGLNGRPAFDAEVMFYRLPQREKVHTSIRSPSPVIVRDQSIEDDSIIVRKRRCLVCVQHRSPFRLCRCLQI